ncbi:LacI family DNA-binding transcriptional regulator [Membranihabitans marinus]|uniref:LacI family DNA-binding transcriptional regulator n=1 Tax=Membranihabitans marinus TaxID=1227546 RepID=UPI001F215C25|nr:LacI family DNA-binding transcriptional regulator [Membranihabitans marinus]
MKNKIKIKDIALRAGVSTGTVDRVIHKRGKVSKKAEDKVLKAMSDLDYSPNIIARTLARKKVTNFSIIIPYPYQDYYWKMIKSGIDTGIGDFEHFNLSGNVYFYDMFDEAHFQSISEQILKEEPDAIIVGSEFNQQTIQFVKKCNRNEIPAIVINAELNSVPCLSYIGTNSYQTGCLTGKLVSIKSNIKNILILHNTSNIQNAAHLKNKEIGLLDYFSENNIDIQPHVLSINDHLLSELEMVKKLKDYIRKHQIDCIYNTSSKGYLIAKSIKGLFPDIYIICHDLIDHNILLLTENKIDIIINQSAEKLGYLSIKTLVNHMILEKRIEKKYYLPLDVVYKENYQFYINNKDINTL